MLAPILLAMFLADAPVAGQATGSQQPIASVTQPTAEKPWPPVGVYRITGGVTAPRLIKSGRPEYPAEAMRAKIQGRVALETVIKPDGTVGEVRVVRSLDRKFAWMIRRSKASRTIGSRLERKTGSPSPCSCPSR
jgi:hypothetical protein